MKVEADWIDQMIRIKSKKEWTTMGFQEQWKEVTKNKFMAGRGEEISSLYRLTLYNEKI